MKDLLFDPIKAKVTGRKVWGAFDRGFDISDSKEPMKKYGLHK